jgi:hypothetical protein
MKSAAALLFAVACLTRAAFADGTDHLAEAAKAHFEQGQTLYAGGQFAEARAEFLAGFELSHKPAFLFNAAECARLMGKTDVARDGYDQYLKLDPNGKLAMLALQRLDELGPKPAEPAKPAAGPPPIVAPTPAPAPLPPPTVAPPAPAAAGIPANATVTSVSVESAEPSNAPQIERYAGIATAGTGVAMLLTGAIFGYRSSTLSSQVSGACASGCVWGDVAGKDSSARTDATVQWWLYGAGAVAVLAGGALYWLGSHTETPILVAPMPSGAAVTWAGRF